MTYPAIKYSRKDVDSRYADDIKYSQFKVYEITVIDKDPDSEFIDKILGLPMCSFDRHYTADNLNHDTFTLYY